jgi:hypothetical protein
VYASSEPELKLNLNRSICLCWHAVGRITIISRTAKRSGSAALMSIRCGSACLIQFICFICRDELKRFGI